MKKTPSITKLIDLALAMTAAGGGNDAYRRRRAFELAHRARRVLENGADTACRDRWSLLTRPEGKPHGDDDLSRQHEFAAAIAGETIDYPIHGEAAVYASLLDAVDVAVSVSEWLYRHWLEVERTEEAAPVSRDALNRLGAPLAPGCIHRGACANNDGDPA